MRRCFLKSLVLVTLTLIGAVGALAQPFIPHIYSVEYTTLNADAIVVGKVVGYTGSDAYPNKRHMTIAVGETLKGTSEETLTLEVTRSTTDLRIWQARGTRLLVFVSKGTTNIVDLDAENLHVSKEDYRLISDPKSVIDYVKEIVRKNPGVNQFPEAYTNAPNNATGEAWRAAFVGPTGMSVPADARLEHLVLSKIRAGGEENLVFGIQELKPFKSERNIALVEDLLKSNVTRLAQDAEYHQGVEVWNYDVREAAYDLLTQQWHIPVAKPVIEKLVPRYDTVETIHWSDPVTDEGLEKLERCKKLTTLDFTGFRSNEITLSVSQIAEIGRFTTLKKLHIEGSEALNDKTIGLWSGLKNLKDLVLFHTSITDEGLKTLVSLKGLRNLFINESEVTEAGIAEFIKLRPDVRVDPIHPTSIINAYAQEGNLAGMKRILASDIGAIEQKGKDGNTPLHEAVQEGHPRIATLLLDNGAQIDALNDHGQTPLELAASRSSMPLCKLLVGRGADFNHVDSDGDTPLQYAAIWCQEPVIRFFLGLGCDPFHKNNIGLTPLDETASRSKPMTAYIAAFESLLKNPIQLIKQTSSKCDYLVFELQPGSLADLSSKDVGRITGPLQWNKTPSGRNILGPLGQQAITLRLSNLPKHQSVTVDIDLFVIGSWDGNGDGEGPDIIDISIPGVGTALHSTFYNNTEGTQENLKIQSFPDPFPFGFHRGYTGAAEVKTLGYVEKFPRDAVYRLHYTFAHADSDIEIVLTGLNVVQKDTKKLEDDEMWGIGGLSVKTD